MDEENQSDKPVSHKIRLDEEKPLKIQLKDLRAEIVGRKVELELELSGEQAFKALPQILRVYCENCEAEDFFDLRDPKNVDLLQMVVFNDKTGLRSILSTWFYNSNGPCDSRGGHRIRIEERDFMDFSILFVRDLLRKATSAPPSFSYWKYQDRKVYLVNSLVPVSRRIRLEGKVVIDPRTRDITVLADKISPAQTDLDTFTITGADKEAWSKIFKDNEDLWMEIAPHIVGEKRILGKKCVLIGIHSLPSIVNLDGYTKVAMIRQIHIGDTKTGKSEILRFLSNEGEFPYPCAAYTPFETASRTGVLYTINVDTKPPTLTWGILPMNDGGAAVLEGMDKWRGEEMKEFREAITRQMVVVSRVVRGKAPMRVRLFGTINMREAEIKGYPFVCQAILDTPLFYDPTNVTRWHFFVPYSREDVPQELIDRRRRADLPIPAKVFYRHILWAWTRKPSQVIITEEAKEKIISWSTNLVKRFGTGRIPIFHPGFREVLTSVSAAVAATFHSTDESHTKVIVRPQDVDYAAILFIEMAKRLELDEFKAKVEGAMTVALSDLEKIIAELDETDLQIMDALVMGPASSAKIAEQLDISPVTVRNRYSTLKDLGIIETGGRKGAYLTAYGIKLWRILNKPNLDRFSEPPLIDKEIPREEKTEEVEEVEGEREDEIEKLEVKGEAIKKKVEKAQSAIDSLISDSEIERDILETMEGSPGSTPTPVDLDYLYVKFQGKYPRERIYSVIAKLIDEGIIQTTFGGLILTKRYWDYRKSVFGMGKEAPS